ncbi:MAG: GYD domain-containing protein [Litoricolaceae bacterium]|nr:GYD domain-containing protein [Litorivicinaceae bacterium]
MLTYMVSAKYTSSAVQGMIENPHNREEAIRALLEKMNITLDRIYFSATGDIFMVVTGNNADVAAMALVVGATGSVENTSAVEVFSAEEQLEQMKVAQSTSGAYKAANS